MKYMLLAANTKSQYEWFESWSKEDLVANINFMRQLNADLEAEGILVSTMGLTGPGQARVVRAGPKGEALTDGVFPEAKEFLAGFWIIDVEGADEAYKVAARISQAPAPRGTVGTMPVEVRQIMETAPREWL